jgi:hypothetical protein
MDGLGGNSGSRALPVAVLARARWAAVCNSQQTIITREWIVRLVAMCLGGARAPVSCVRWRWRWRDSRISAGQRARAAFSRRHTGLGVGSSAGTGTGFRLSDSRRLLPRDDSGQPRATGTRAQPWHNSIVSVLCTGTQKQPGKCVGPARRPQVVAVPCSLR